MLAVIGNRMVFGCDLSDGSEDEEETNQRPCGGRVSSSDCWKCHNTRKIAGVYLGTVVLSGNPSTWEAKAGGAGVQGHPWLNCELQAVLVA